MPPPFPREPAPLEKDALARWVSVPDDVPIDIKLNKFELEQAYLAFREVVEAQGHLQQALVHLSNQNMGYANESMRHSQNALVRSYDALNFVFSALMRVAEPRHE